MKRGAIRAPLPSTYDRNDRCAGKAPTFFIEDHAIASALLRNIEAAISAAEYLRVRLIFRRRGNTDTDRQRIDLILRCVKRRIFYFCAYALCNPHTGLSTGTRQKNAEFFPTDTADKIAFSRHILKRECDQLQGTVADAMAKRIVDRLKMVGIDNEQGAGFDTERLIFMASNNASRLRRPVMWSIRDRACSSTCAFSSWR